MSGAVVDEETVCLMEPDDNDIEICISVDITDGQGCCQTNVCGQILSRETARTIVAIEPVRTAKVSKQNIGTVHTVNVSDGDSQSNSRTAGKLDSRQETSEAVVHIEFVCGSKREAARELGRTEPGQIEARGIQQFVFGQFAQCSGAVIDKLSNIELLG